MRSFITFLKNNINSIKCKFQHRDNIDCELSNIINIFLNHKKTSDYFKTHTKRYKKTGEFISNYIKNNGGTALEVGATDLFQTALKHIYGFHNIYGTIFSGNDKIIKKTFSFLNYSEENIIFNVDLDQEKIPLDDNSVDFILCCDVIEHLEKDPMHMLFEFNRILKQDGLLFISTPNSCSARIFKSIFYNYRPHFYMQYTKKCILGI